MNIIKYFREFKRTQNEIYWSTVFNSTIADSKWLKNRSFSPGRWAAGYPMLYLLYRIYDGVKPVSILEFGLGESSKLLYQYKNVHHSADYIIIEQDKNWLDFFSSNIHDLNAQTKLLNIDKSIINKHEVYIYKDLLPAIKNKKYDLIVVDGPWGSYHYSRHQIIDIAEADLLSDAFIIIIDDYNRKGEKETAHDLRRVLVRKGISFKEGVYSGSKDTLIICSEEYNFLISL